MIDGILDTPTQTPEPRDSRRGRMALWGAVVLLGAFSAGGVASGRSARAAQTRAIDRLSRTVATTQATSKDLALQLETTSSRLDAVLIKLAAIQDSNAERTRALDRRSRARVQRLEGVLQQQRARVGELGGGIDGVRTEVASNRRDIDRAVGVLGEQRDLVTRNHQDLEALKRSRSREYVSFDLRKSGAFEQVGPLSVRLDKTDDRRQRYTVTIAIAGKHVEKRDNALLEPVRFSIPGTHNVLELVARQIQDGRVVGYISSPKETAPAS